MVFLLQKKNHNKELHICSQATIFWSVQADADQNYKIKLECSVFSYFVISLVVKIMSPKTH